MSKSKKQSRSVCTHSSSSSSTRSYLKKWEQEFTWLEYDADGDGAFCRLCKISKRSPGKTGGFWTTKLFSYWKKAIKKMRAHAKSNAHILATQEAVMHQTSQQVGSVVQQLQAVAEKEQKANRRAVKSFFSLCTFPC